ncbi:MAG: c-type cytochrome [Gemmatimonadetes bacterium]|nr:c-type cytochrome [Gemmatimonadota bacterium]MBI2401343.1 c-type cytochrome [Gemmatimonadota bacterium]MBI2536179.1 c-type cytochrome [Gemmatimonadota bacterium]
MRHTLGMFAIAAMLLPTTPRPFGGWTVITVRDLPEYLEVGAPTKLVFDIRQHGRTLMNDRSPAVTLKKAGSGLLSRKPRFAAARAQDAGQYVATVTAEEPGIVEITIDADWHGSDVKLVPMRMVARGEKPVPLASHDRGRQLFVAAGCVTCHAKLDDPQLGDRKAIPVGPVLTGRQFPVEWLAQQIADPARFRVGTGQEALMPQLGLSERDISAVVSYVNYRQQAAAVTVGR